MTNMIKWIFRLGRQQVSHSLLITAAVVIGVRCGGGDVTAPTSGNLHITTVTSGPEPDADGYSVTLDGSARGTVGPTDELTLNGVEPGDHQVGLSGIAGNCQAEALNPRTVTVNAGTTSTAAFVITCITPPPATGTLTVTAATTGTNLDPDGYSFVIDGGAAQAIGLNATVTITNVGAGTHTVTLSGMAGNCSVQDTNPRSVTLVAAATANVSFAVVCAAATGSLEISTTTTGASPDPDGYILSVDDQGPQAIATNGTLSISDLAPGAHSVTISGFAANCQVTGDNPKSVTVLAGATASIAFSISCPTPGIARWTPMTSGTTRTLRHISGGSATSVFAIGQPASGLRGYPIFHYDGATWSPQLSENDLALTGVWATPSEAFAIGLDPDYSHGSFLHYNGQAWSEMTPAIPGECCGIFIYGIWGSSGRNVFAVGSWNRGFGSDGAYIVHYDGNAWVRMPVENDQYISLSDVWGSAGNDVYAVGGFDPYMAPRGSDGTVIMHYDGERWSKVLHEGGLRLTSIWGSSASDIYATGSTTDPVRGAIWHFDGSGWSAMTSPTTEQLGPISGSSASDIFVLASDNTIWHFDGANWKQSLRSATTLDDIWVSSPTSAFAVGANGTILHGTP